MDVQNASADVTINNNISQENDVVNERNAGTSVLQRVELLSMNGEQISVEEAQEASGYGENGAMVLAESVNSAEGRSFSEIKSEMHNAYLAGRSNKRVNPESFTTDIELKAYTAGRQDGELGRIKLQESRGSVENKTDGEKITLTNTDDNSMIKSRFRNDTDGKIRFNQENIDYENSSYREESFNLIGQNNGKVETTKGRVVGKYGVHKKSNGYYGVTLLSAGMDIAAFKTESEAALFATYANETIPFNDISFVRNADGRIVVDTSTAEFMQYGEQIKELKDNKSYLQDSADVFDDDVSFSIETLPGTDKKYVKADEQIIKSENPDDWEKEIFDYVNKVVRKGSDFVIPIDNEESIVITERTAWKLSDRGNLTDDKYYMVKGNASGVIDEIISVSKYSKSKPPMKKHSNDFARFGFDYRVAYFMDLDGKYYRLKLSVGINSENKEAYNIGEIKQVAIPSNRLKGPKGITTYDFSLSHKDDVVNSSISEKSKNDTKGVVRNEEGRDDTISGSLGRSVGESAGKPSGSVSEATGKVQEDGGARTDTESARRIYAENVRYVQGTEVRRQGPFQCEFIKPEYYTDDMRAIEEENKAQGLNTYFFFGGGKYKNKFVFRGAISKNDVYIRCDHAKYSPEQINKHEKVHHKYKTKEIEKIRNYIEKRLTKAEKEHIINTMYARYSLACKGNPNKIFEEFVCDVLADMNDYGAVFKDIADAYWNNDTDLIDSYTAADYAESTDAGGTLFSAQEYDDTLYSLDRKWYPDLSRNQLSKLKDFLRKDVRTSTHSITDTANWVYTTIGKIKVFAIYSTENTVDPTLLYESKGRQGEFEKDYLLNLLEEWNYGKSNDGKSSGIDEILSDEGLQKRYSVQNNNGTVGRGQYLGNDTVLSRKSKRKPTGAFANVIENLFKIQNEIDTADDISFSFDEDGEYDLFDIWKSKVEEFGAIPRGEKPARDIDVPKKITNDKKVSQTVRTILEAKATPDDALPTIEKMVLDGAFSYDTYTDKQAIADAEGKLKGNGL